jgi:hypothetical protein
MRFDALSARNRARDGILQGHAVKLYARVLGLEPLVELGVRDGARYRLHTDIDYLWRSDANVGNAAGAMEADTQLACRKLNAIGSALNIETVFLDMLLSDLLIESYPELHATESGVLEVVVFGLQ